MSACEEGKKEEALEDAQEGSAAHLELLASPWLSLRPSVIQAGHSGAKDERIKQALIPRACLSQPPPHPISTTEPSPPPPPWPSRVLTTDFTQEVGPRGPDTSTQDTWDGDPGAAPSWVLCDLE